VRSDQLAEDHKIEGTKLVSKFNALDMSLLWPGGLVDANTYHAMHRDKLALNAEM